MKEYVSERTENVIGNGENAPNHHFPPFFHIFYLHFLHKTRIFLIKGKGFLCLSDSNTYLTIGCLFFLPAPFSCLPAFHFLFFLGGGVGGGFRIITITCFLMIDAAHLHLFFFSFLFLFARRRKKKKKKKCITYNSICFFPIPEFSNINTKLTKR